MKTFKFGLNHWALLGANVIYAASNTIIKTVLGVKINPNGFIYIRIIGALLLILAYLFIGKKSFRIEKKDILLLFICALFGVAINMLLFFQGLSRTSPINASIIMVMTPIIVTIIGYFRKSERFNSINIIGIALGAIGAIGLTLAKGKSIGLSQSTPLGDFLILLNASSYAIYLVIVRKLTIKYDPILITFYCFLIGSFYVLPFAFNDLTLIKWDTFSQNNFLALGFVIFATTFLTYVFNAYALKHTQSSIVGAYIYIQPILGTFIAVVFGAYLFQSYQLIFGVLIILGVYLTTLKSKKQIVQV